MQKLRVCVRCLVPVQHHAPRDPPLDGGRFIEGKIDASVVAQMQQDFQVTLLVGLGGGIYSGLGEDGPREFFGVFCSFPSPGATSTVGGQRGFVVRGGTRAFFVFRRECSSRTTGDIGMLRDAGQLLRDGFRRKHKIDTTRARRAARHRIVCGGIILGERDAALCLDRLQAQRAVRRRSGKDHADRSLALILGERFEKGIDGAGPAGLATGLQFQNTLRDAERRVWRNDVNVIRRHAQIVGHFQHRHLRRPRQNLRQRTVVLRIEMLHQHETQSCVYRQPFQQTRERFQTTR
jgi:hypothetical protein